MTRVRQQPAAPAKPVRRKRALNVETMRSAADDFLSRFGSLIDEVVALREALAQAQAENAHLQAELAEAVVLFRDARELVTRAEPVKRRTGRAAKGTSAAPAPRAATRPRTRSASRDGAARTSANGRATPPSVTADVVRAVIGKLGTATAGEIAGQITAAGTPVSGRAIRHIAKGAGAVMRPGDDGRMIYSLS